MMSFRWGSCLPCCFVATPRALISVKDVVNLPCEDDLQGIVAKAICRRNRFATALDMIRALQGHDYTEHQPLESLEGKTVAFTGPLSIRRFDAEVLVRQAGASISDQVTSRVNVIVQGRVPPLRDATQEFEAAGRGEAHPARRADLDHQ